MNKELIEYLEFLLSNRITGNYSLNEIRKEIQSKIEEENSTKSDGGKA